MPDDKNKLKVVFTPGCFDEFDGTQEELDALMKEILAMAESGELEENATLIETPGCDVLDDEYAESFNYTNRKLH